MPGENYKRIVDLSFNSYRHGNAANTGEAVNKQLNR